MTMLIFNEIKEDINKLLSELKENKNIKLN